MFKKKNQTNTEEQLNSIEEQLTELELLRKSIDEHKRSLKSFWKSFLITGIVMTATIIVVLFCAMAWFVANNRTNAGSASVSANGSYTFSLATLKNNQQGVYDVNEQTSSESPLAKALSKFFRADHNGRDDQGKYYYTFLDLPNLSIGTTEFVDDKGDTYILGDSDGISLMVNSENNVNNTETFEHIGPGSYGKFTFYIIPHIDSFDKVNLSISLKPFTLQGVENTGSGIGATGRAVAVENNSNNNTVLLNLLQGHILLFTGKDSDGNYSNRLLPNLEADGRISFKFTMNKQTTNWVKDQAEPVTIYWIWPKRFENIKYCGQEDSVFRSSCTGHIALLNWINTNRACVANPIQSDINNLADPTKNMTNQQFAKWSVGYNKGDQLIGDNIAFFKWIIEAE